jgi:hypothetical protein
MATSASLSLLARGNTVSTAATTFDVEGEPKWSEAVYGDCWATARVHGVVRSVKDRTVTVRWEDGDVSTLDIDQVRATAATFRRAETDLEAVQQLQRRFVLEPMRRRVDSDPPKPMPR